MLVKQYFQFFNETQINTLDEYVQQNYFRALEDFHFYWGHLFMPSSYDILYDPKESFTLRKNIGDLMYDAVALQIEERNPELIQTLGKNSSAFSMLCFDAMQEARLKHEHAVHADIHTFFYLRSMAFREGKEICNSALIGVW